MTTQWYVHYTGSDDLIPAESEEAAREDAEKFNHFWALRTDKHALEPVVHATAVTWENRP